MSTKDLKRVGSSFAYSVLEGAGSILNLGSVGFGPFKHSSMARQDRDVRAIRGDWQRIGKDLQLVMNKIRRESGINLR